MPALPDNADTQPMDIMHCPSPAWAAGSTEGLSNPDRMATTQELREKYQHPAGPTQTLSMPGCAESCKPDLAAPTNPDTVPSQPAASEPPALDHEEDDKACVPRTC